MDDSTKALIQKNFFDFALVELISQHRTSFEPLWTIDSWVKLLIWLALNCGLPGDRENLKSFAEALGPALTARMRGKFFERTLDNLKIRLMADPADNHVLVMPIAQDCSLTHKKALEALKEVGLVNMVVQDSSNWETHEDLIAIPWKISTKHE